jgi:hypothetical protein
MVWTLEVRRAEFLNALRRTVSIGKKNALEPPVLFAFSDGQLSVEGVGVAAEIPASGEWPGVAAVPAAMLRQLTKAFPEEDPLRLQADDQRFTVSRFSMPCERRPIPAPPTSNSADAPNSLAEPKEGTEGGPPARFSVGHEKKVGEILAKAANVLKPYGVSEADLRSLVEKHAAGRLNPLAGVETPVIKRIAEAWSLLAPLGVEPNEIKGLVDESILNAWKR